MVKETAKLSIKLNLFKPQSNPEKLFVRLFHWLLASGRYIFVFVEALVLIAFGARFKLDADMAAKKEAIEEQIPYIESLKPYETLIRQIQLKLSTIDTVRANSQDFSTVLQKIAGQIPASVKITAINISKNVNSSELHITGQTQVNSDLAGFISGLKGDSTFSNINLANVGLEEGIIKFTIDANAKAENTGGAGT